MSPAAYNAPSFGLCHMGMLERAPVSAFGTCDRSVFCDLSAASPGRPPALTTTGGRNSCVLLALRVFLLSVADAVV